MIFNFTSKDIIPNNDYFIFSSNLGPLTKIGMSVQSNKAFEQISGIHKVDPDYINQHFKKEIHDHIKSHVRRGLKLDGEIIDYLFIDLDSTQTNRDLNNFYEIILLHDPKYIRVSVGIFSSALEDLCLNRNGFMYDVQVNEFPYRIGNLGGISVEADPYLNYDDDIVYMFDSIEINVENIDISDGWQDNNLVDRVTFDFAFKINNPRSIAIVTGPKSRHWNDWIKIKRNSKIDGIVGD